jgi:hypothetical protein
LEQLERMDVHPLIRIAECSEALDPLQVRSCECFLRGEQQKSSVDGAHVGGNHGMKNYLGLQLRESETKDIRFLEKKSDATKTVVLSGYGKPAAPRDSIERAVSTASM